MFTFQRPTMTPDSSRRSSTSLSSPMSCRLFERFTSTMKDLEDGLREMGAFPWWKDENLRYELQSLSYSSRPGHLRAIRWTPWSRKLEICCRSGRWPPPPQQSATLVPQKRAQLSLCLVFCPLLLQTVSSQVTCSFLRREKRKALGTEATLQNHKIILECCTIGVLRYPPPAASQLISISRPTPEPTQLSSCLQNSCKG